VDRVTPEQSEVLKKHAKAHLWDRTCKGSRLWTLDLAGEGEGVQLCVPPPMGQMDVIT
jgi:hypothetical protein